MNVYIVFDASIDDEPIVAIVGEADIAQYKQRKLDELEKKVRDEYMVIWSLKRVDTQEVIGGHFGVDAIVSRKVGDEEKFLARETMVYRPMEVWRPK